jgi:hypothetical protein
MPVKMTIEEATARLAQHGYEMVNPEMFKDTNTRLTFKCTTHGTTWEATTQQAYGFGKKCPGCPTENWKDALTRKKFTLQCSEKFAATLSPQDRVTVMCEEGHSFEVRLCYAKSHVCQECLGRKIPIEEVQRKLDVLGFSLVDIDKFKNIRADGTFKCRENHSWTTCISNVISEKSGCPECGLGMNERKAIWAITKLTGGVFQKTRDVLPCRYELDGYCDDLKIAIEYNGIQHYKFIGRHFHKGGVDLFEAQQVRDATKVEECTELGISLVVVPYTCKTFESIWVFVKQALGEFNIPTLDVDIETAQGEYQQSFRPLMSMMQQFHALATAKCGVCISSVYEGETHPYTYQCANPNHDPFGMTKFDIKRGRWCRMCSSAAPITVDRINEIIGVHGFVFASPGYTTGSAKYDFRCVKCNTVNNTSWENFKQRCSRGYKHCKPAKPGRGSVNYPKTPKPRAPVAIPDDRKTDHIKELSLIATQHGGECLSKEYLGHKAKHLFRCSAGHEWEATSNSIKIGTWCAACAGKKKDDIESAKTFCNANGWIFKSPTYSTASTKYKYNCAKCGFAREMIWTSFKARAKSGCSKCKKASE